MSVAILHIVLLSVAPIEPRCGSDNFTCENGECISQSDVCNQRDDCADASDEAGCGMWGSNPLVQVMLIQLFIAASISVD